MHVGLSMESDAAWLAERHIPTPSSSAPSIVSAAPVLATAIAERIGG